MILANIWRVQKNTLQLSFWKIVNFLKKRGSFANFWGFKNVHVSKHFAWRGKTENISPSKGGDRRLARDHLYHGLKAVTQCKEAYQKIAWYSKTPRFRFVSLPENTQCGAMLLCSVFPWILFIVQSSCSFQLSNDRGPVIIT